MTLTKNEKLWLIGSAIMSGGLMFDLGAFAGISIFGGCIMLLGFIRAFLASLEYESRSR